MVIVVPPIMLTIEPRMNSIFLACSPNFSFKCMSSFWYLFLKPHQTKFSWSNESQFLGSAIEEVNSPSNFHIPLKSSWQPILLFWEILMHISMWKRSKYLFMVFIEEASRWKCALACLLLRCRHLSAFHTCHSKRESVICYTRSLIRSFPTNITSQLLSPLIPIQCNI